MVSHVLVLLIIQECVGSRFTPLYLNDVYINDGIGRNTYRASGPLLFATGLLFFSFYLQSAWTEGKAIARWLEWPKLGLVLFGLGYLPLSPVMELILQVYLLISVLLLLWLTVNPVQGTASKPAA